MRLSGTFVSVNRGRREKRRAIGKKARSRRAHGPTSLMEWVPYASPELDEPVHLAAVCDELQKVIALVKANDYDVPLQFVNYR